MADFVLALDQGTSSSRAILFDRAGTPVASAQSASGGFEQIYPQPGWVEHDPEAIWRTQLETARQALAQANATAADVAAIGITNQRETTLIWDREGQPIANAVVWQDRRTAGICEELRARGLEPLFRERTGLLLDPYFSGTKVKWLVDSWLIYRLTGAHATDYSNASRTLMYDIFQRRWDGDLLEALDVPPSLLPH